MKTYAFGAICVLFCLTLTAADWPQYRGPNRDGHAPGANIKAWTDAGPKEVWRIPIGQGFAAITVSGDHLYTSFADGDKEYLGAFDAATGEEQWRKPIGGLFTDSFGDGPRSAPVIDGDWIYALGSHGEIHAFNRKNGEAQWSVKLTEDYTGKTPRWGYSMSPMVDGDRILLEAGGGENKAIVALNKKSGAKIWSAYTGSTGYSSPIVMTFNGQKQYVFLATLPPSQPGRPGTQRAIGLSPDGKTLWEHDVAGFLVAMPVKVGDDRIFVSSSDDNGGALLKLKADGDTIAVETLWTSRFMKNHFNSSIYHDGHIYGFSNAILTCISAETGERVWVKRGLGKGSMTLAGDHFIALGDKGKLALFEASAESYKQAAPTIQAMKGKSWTQPTIVGGKLYMRNQQEMVCMDLGV